jgi:hypothetical protein
MKLKTLKTLIITILLITTSLSVNANEISLKCIQVIDDHQHKGSTSEIEMILNIDKEKAFITKPLGVGKFDENGHGVFDGRSLTEEYVLTEFPTHLFLQNIERVNESVYETKYVIDREDLGFTKKNRVTGNNAQIGKTYFGACAIVETKSDKKI